MEKRVFENDYVSFHFDNGILYGKYKVSTIDLATAKIATDFRKEITGGVKVPAVADISCVKHVDKSTRTYFSSVEAGKDLIALAIILSNPVTRMIGNFFLKFHRPEYPFRFFTDLEQATLWIEEFTENYAAG
uniref:DUF7793 domain-containing protein n=1 Tax=Roseihalotalea indica TaxID=2867963 RepID=A0AA49GL42_9BACT|nr:hypothetical protein K4G66_31185 [Tunicatimonas sp. TK19036]